MTVGPPSLLQLVLVAMEHAPSIILMHLAIHKKTCKLTWSSNRLAALRPTASASTGSASGPWGSLIASAEYTASSLVSAHKVIPKPGLKPAVSDYAWRKCCRQAHKTDKSTLVKIMHHACIRRDKSHMSTRTLTHVLRAASSISPRILPGSESWMYCAVQLHLIVRTLVSKWPNDWLIKPKLAPKTDSVGQTVSVRGCSSTHGVGCVLIRLLLTTFTWSRLFNGNTNAQLSTPVILWKFTLPHSSMPSRGLNFN